MDAFSTQLISRMRQTMVRSMLRILRSSPVAHRLSHTYVYGYWAQPRRVYDRREQVGLEGFLRAFQQERLRLTPTPKDKANCDTHEMWSICAV